MAGERQALGSRTAPVRRLRRLIGKRQDREAEGAFVVEGVRGVSTALESQADVDSLFVDAEAAADSLLRACEARGVPVHRLAPGVIDAVTDTVTPQGVAAIVRGRPIPLDDLADLARLLVLVDVRDPGNAGTLIRTAEAAGASAVVFCRGSVDALSPKVVRASAGAVFHIPLVQAGDAGEVLDVLAQRGARRIGTSVQDGESYDSLDWAPPVALVMGNEAWGLPDHLEGAIDQWAQIPMAGRADSLNVAAAAAVLLFEAVRDRGAGS